MSEQTAQAARAEIMQTLNERLTAITQAQRMLEGVLLGQGWVVRCERIYFTFKVEDKVATAPKFVPVERAMRFTERDAKSLAANIKNGHGTVADAIHINDALAEERAEIERLIKFVEGRSQASA